MTKIATILTLTFLLPCMHVAVAQRKIDKVLEKITPVPESKKTLDIPRYASGHPFIFWHYCKQKQAQLGLSSPETSNDSLLLRVWATQPTSKKNQRHDFAEIRYLDGRWEARVINMRVDLNSMTDEKITKFVITEVSPVAGWKHLVDSLYYYHVNSLPTDERLPDYEKVTSGYANSATTFSFEYATPRTYRFYQYNDPWKLAEHYDQAVDAANILHMLDREFGIDSLSTEFKKKFERHR
jgi:hypothetical protein